MAKFQGKGVDFWIRARRALDQLHDQFLENPEVSLIEIGYNATASDIVLQVFVRRQVSRQALGLPDEIDGIPVHLVVGKFQPE